MGRMCETADQAGAAIAHMGFPLVSYFNMAVNLLDNVLSYQETINYVHLAKYYLQSPLFVFQNMIRHVLLQFKLALS